MHRPISFSYHLLVCTMHPCSFGGSQLGLFWFALFGCVLVSSPVLVLISLRLVCCGSYAPLPWFRKDKTSPTQGMGQVTPNLSAHSICVSNGAAAHRTGISKPLPFSLVPCKILPSVLRDCNLDSFHNWFICCRFVGFCGSDCAGSCP